MSLVVFENVTLGFGGKSIVDGMNLRIADRDRIGLVGPNGSGKTTILRMLAGEQAPDSGAIRLRRALRVGYLPQDVAIAGGRSLRSFVIDSVPGKAELETEIASIEAQLEGRAGGDAQSEDVLDLSDRLAHAHERFARFEELYSPFTAHAILAGLGFRPGDIDRDIGELSGGWKMRAVLAALLFQQPDVLLLDEPTNHLDMPSVAWFSSFLGRYGSAFVLISHDREFLNEQISRVVSLELEGVRSYVGNYDQYERQRAEEEEVLENKAKNVEQRRVELERFVERFKAKASKATQARSRMKMLEKLETVETRGKRRSMRFTFPETVRPGRDVLTGAGLRKAYGEHVVLDSVDVRVERGDRIAIIGVNGAGKTTLLRMLAGELPVDSGVVERGHQVILGYYAQHHVDVLHPAATPYEEVSRMDPEANQTRVRAVLGAFLFSGDDVDKRISVLSGGERARVALARLLIKPGNVLLMDEPTNHLDLDSSESLAESLAAYDGTLVFVSHNKGFVRRLATKIWSVEDGRVVVYPGTFDEYLESHRARTARDAPAVSASKPSPAGRATTPSTAPRVTNETRDAEKDRKRRDAELRTIRKKRLEPLEKRAKELEERVARLEREQATRTEELSDPKLYEDVARRDAVMRDFSRAKAELEVASDTWLEVQEELEQVKTELEGLAT